MRVFDRFAERAATAAGSSIAFAAAAGFVVGWLVSGPVFKWSDTWQLYANTGTTIITFLLGFILQNSQNRNAKALHLKLDELLIQIEGPRSELAGIEAKTEAEIEALRRS